jgi:transketolase
MGMNKTSMRDAFFDELYEIARKDRDVVLLSADMGAPSLDKFREDLAGQYINVGIAEQNMINLATGLALEGKKVFVYAIMPFATQRCYEVIKVNLSLMNIPVTVVGVGAGFGYDDSGPTHHATEDLATMRALPNMNIICPSDIVMTAEAVHMSYQMTTPNYVRLDREVLPVIYQADTDFSDGLSVLRDGNDVAIISAGNMVHIALEIAEKLKNSSIATGVIDLYRIKPINQELLLKSLKLTKRVVTLEEHVLDGGLGSAALEVLADCGKTIPVKRFGIPNRYLYAYGGRRNIQTICGLDPDYVSRTILEWMQPNG